MLLLIKNSLQIVKSSIGRLREILLTDIRGYWSSILTLLPKNYTKPSFIRYFDLRVNKERREILGRKD